jgi:hypothetical protein
MRNRTFGNWDFNEKATFRKCDLSRLGFRVDAQSISEAE